LWKTPTLGAEGGQAEAATFAPAPEPEVPEADAFDELPDPEPPDPEPPDPDVPEEEEVDDAPEPAAEPEVEAPSVLVAVPLPSDLAAAFDSLRLSVR
jgi:hypothetical protein